MFIVLRVRNSDRLYPIMLCAIYLCIADDLVSYRQPPLQVLGPRSH